MDRKWIYSGAVICVTSLADEVASALSELSLRIGVAQLYSDYTTDQTIEEWWFVSC
jgi:hypothetical protein